MTPPLYDGMWEGRPAFLLGGGGSLRDFDWRLLRGRNTIGINMAFLKDPSMAFIVDDRICRRLLHDSRWGAFRGLKVGVDTDLPFDQLPDAAAFWKGAQRFPGRPERWCRSLDEGILVAAQSGIMALNLADILGAEPIYLLGFDGCAGAWHDEYPVEWRSPPDAYEHFVKEFRRWAPEIHHAVINLCPGSRIDAFPKQFPEEVLR